MVENRVNFKLRYMLAGTDEEFDERVRAAVERRQRFELGIADNDPAESQTDDSIESASVDFSIADCSSSDTQTEENSQRLISSR